MAVSSGSIYADAFARYFAYAASEPEGGPPEFVPYEGSESYSPVPYLAYVPVALISKALGLKFLATLYVMRLAGLFASAVLGAYAIAGAPHLKWIFFCTAMLPTAIYQRAEAQPGSFLRALVGVLEATTGSLDARIASMGSRIHPSTAPEEWLDFVARWLGLPWDDGLTLEQKQRLVRRAPELAQARGTRAGLEALLESLIPGPPRRFRVTDATAKPAPAQGFELRQETLENSNASSAEAAVRLVTVMRQFEMLQKAVLLGVEMNRRALEEVAHM